MDLLQSGAGYLLTLCQESVKTKDWSKFHIDRQPHAISQLNVYLSSQNVWWTLQIRKKENMQISSFAYSVVMASNTILVMIMICMMFFRGKNCNSFGEVQLGSQTVLGVLVPCQQCINYTIAALFTKIYSTSTYKVLKNIIDPSSRNVCITTDIYKFALFEFEM